MSQILISLRYMPSLPKPNNISKPHLTTSPRYPPLACFVNTVVFAWHSTGWAPKGVVPSLFHLACAGTTWPSERVRVLSYGEGSRVYDILLKELPNIAAYAYQDVHVWSAL